MPKHTAKISHFFQLKNIKWMGVIMFSCVWMFILGIFVGRGTAPIKFDMEKLQKKLIALKEEDNEKEREKLDLYLEEAQNKTNLNFYEALKKPQVSTGTASVNKIESGLHPDSFSPAEAGEKRLTIQIASLKDAAAADTMVKKLREQGYQEAYRSIGNIPGKGIWYRVRIGYFLNKSEAETALSRLRKDEYKPLIVSASP